MTKTFCLLLITIATLVISSHNIEEKTELNCGKVAFMHITADRFGTPKYFISAAGNTGEVHASTYAQYKVGDNFCWKEPLPPVKDVWFYLMCVSLILSIILVIILFNLQ